jgi:hypothetical protein
MRFDPFEMARLLPEWQSEAHVTLAPADSMLWARLVAWLRAGHYDRLLAVATTVEEGNCVGCAGRTPHLRHRA